jgi:SPP1 family predicted phage head-tail adaptor
MTSGRLNKPIRIERNEGLIADFGEGTEDWVPYRDCFAEIRPQSATERAVNQGMEPATSHAIRIRHDPQRPTDAGMRIRFEGRLFAIRGVHNPDEKGEFLVLACDEIGKVLA